LEWTRDESWARLVVFSAAPGLGGPRASGGGILIVDWTETSNDCERLTTRIPPESAGRFAAIIGTGTSSGRPEVTGGDESAGPNSDMTEWSAEVGKRSTRDDGASSASRSGAVGAAGNNEDALRPERTLGDARLQPSSSKSVISQFRPKHFFNV
jgi:hypothetical protein